MPRLAGPLPLALLLAPAAADAGGWRVETAVGYGTSIAASGGPAPHLPVALLGAGWESEAAVLMLLRARFPLVLALPYGRLEASAGAGWEPTLRQGTLEEAGERIATELRLSTRVEGGYGMAVNDVQEGYLAGPDGLSYVAPFGRLELGLRWLLRSAESRLGGVALGFAVGLRVEHARYRVPADRPDEVRWGPDGCLMLDVAF